MQFLEARGWVLGAELERWIWEMVERYGVPERCSCGAALEPDSVKVTSNKGRLWAKCVACEKMYRVEH
jgi:hypothetical protein